MDDDEIEAFKAQKESGSFKPPMNGIDLSQFAIEEEGLDLNEELHQYLFPSTDGKSFNFFNKAIDVNSNFSFKHIPPR